MLLWLALTTHAADLDLATETWKAGDTDVAALVVGPDPRGVLSAMASGRARCPLQGAVGKATVRASVRAGVVTLDQADGDLALDLVQCLGSWIGGLQLPGQGGTVSVRFQVGTPMAESPPAALPADVTLVPNHLGWVLRVQSKRDVAACFDRVAAAGIVDVQGGQVRRNDFNADVAACVAAKGNGITKITLPRPMGLEVALFPSPPEIDVAPDRDRLGGLLKKMPLDSFELGRCFAGTEGTFAARVAIAGDRLDVIRIESDAGPVAAHCAESVLESFEAPVGEDGLAWLRWTYRAP